MNINYISKNKSILSILELNNILEREKIIKNLTSNKNFITLGELLVDNKSKDINSRLIFNGYKEFVFRIYNNEKLDLNDKNINLDIEKLIANKISINYILFFLTRPDFKQYIKLSKKGNFIKKLTFKDFCNIPIPKPNKFSDINSDILTKIIEELLLAEEKNMYFIINIISGTIIEFILENLVFKEEIHQKIKDKFKMLGGLIELVKIYDLVKDEHILIKMDSIKNNRNIIHPNKSINMTHDEVKNKAKRTIIDLEEIILYFGL